MYQIMIEALLPVTTGLKCRMCKRNTATMTSSWRDLYECYYDHVVNCSNCGDKYCPTGVKSFILEHWED